MKKIINSVCFFLKKVFKKDVEHVDVIKPNKFLIFFGYIIFALGLLSSTLSLALCVLQIVSFAINKTSFDFIFLVTLIMVLSCFILSLIYAFNALNIKDDVKHHKAILVFASWNFIIGLISFFWMSYVPLNYKIKAIYFLNFISNLIFPLISLGISIYFYVIASKFIIEAKKQNIEATHLLEVYHLRKYFPTSFDFFGRTIKWTHAVEDVSFFLDKGKTFGIVGESGCGKTTLGRTILRLYDVQGGKVVFKGNDITNLTTKEMNKYRTKIQYVFQDPYSSLPPRMPIGEIIAEPVRIHHIVPKEKVKEYVLKVMKDCGLQEHFYDRYPHEFSGGQRQRIGIARALALKPELVILDEPVSALDVSIQAQIINLLKSLQAKEGFTYIFITHDISVVKYISDEIGVMYLGSMVEKGSNEAVFANPLHPYTKALFSAVPIADPNIKMNRIILKGDIPSPSNPPSGCKFHTRCANCMDRCKKEAPEFIEYEPGHFIACHLYEKK